MSSTAPEQQPQTAPQVALPGHLEDEIRKLEKDFTVDTQKLREIVSQFQTELAEGLEKHQQNIAMYITWVMGFPSGNETGSYLTLDLGGTNLRVCWVELNGRGNEIKVTQDKYRLAPEIKTGEAEQLWTFVAECIEAFVSKHKLASSEDDLIPFAFTFSYPTIQNAIDHGTLVTWTKGFDIKGVEGQDVVAQVKEAIAKKNLPIRLAAVVNDTTGAMIASSYHDTETIIGAIFGTGCNAAYMEHAGAIPKMKDAKIPDDREIAINCEYGAFDNSHSVLPRNKYDLEIDRTSPRPGEQTFEKLSAGNYMGEMLRLVLVDLYDRGLIFQEQDVSVFRKGYELDTGFLSQIEDDASPQQRDTNQLFKDTLNIDPTPNELILSKRLAEAIATRGARLCSCGVAAICRNKGVKTGHVAADGSVANKRMYYILTAPPPLMLTCYPDPKFKARWAEAMAEVLEWPQDRKEDPIIITSAEDGSAIGAAIIAAMTDDRAKKGDLVGIKEEKTRRLSRVASL